MKTKELDNTFIKKLFHRSIKEKKVNDCQLVSITKLSGDASTRTYYRAITDQCSYIICLDDPSKHDLAFIKTQNVFSSNNVRVPKVFDSVPDKGYLLQEDLGDQMLLDLLAKVQSKEDELNIYKKCLSQLLEIHSIDTTKYSNELFSKLAFDKEKLMSEIEHTITHFINAFLNHSPKVETLNLIQTTFGKMCDEIAQQKRLLTHRDFHSKNIMVSNQNEFCIIDFQDARMGIPQYDLASILDDCYYKIDPSNKLILLKYYWDNLKENLSYNSSFEEFKYYYDIMSIQRIFKAIGTFSYMFCTKKDVKYVKYIGFAFENLRAKLLEFNKFNKLRTTISSIYYANQ